MSRGTADAKNALEVRKAFKTYLSSLREQWVRVNLDLLTPPIDTAFFASIKFRGSIGLEQNPREVSARLLPEWFWDIERANREFRRSQTEFRRVRRMLRRQGFGNVVDELQDLRDERAEVLYKWIFTLQNYFNKFLDWRDILRLDIQGQHNYCHQMSVMRDGMTNYLSCLEEEAALVFDALGEEAFANLREWQSATGDDVREVKTAAESSDANAAAAKTAATESKSLLDQIVGFFKAHIIPRTSNYAVTQKALSQLLEKFNAKVTERQIKRWEQFIKTNGRKGSKQPDGYTLETRKTLAGATAWVQNYADLEKGRLNTKVSLEKRFGNNL